MNWARCLNASSCGGTAPSGARFCRACRESLAAVLEPRGYGADNIEGLPLLHGAEDTGTWAQLLRRAKRQSWGIWDPGLESFYREICQRWSGELARLRPDALVWLPASPARVWRETDLAAHCALWLARDIGVPAPRVLRRKWGRLSRAQKGRSRRERWASLVRKGDWHWDDEAEQRWSREGGGRRVLLIDDLCVTGASLLKARAYLEARGYAAVGAWVLARRNHTPA
jgi:predicted amidophosphoribosyltransferase